MSRAVKRPQACISEIGQYLFSPQICFASTSSRRLPRPCRISDSKKCIAGFRTFSIRSPLGKNAINPAAPLPTASRGPPSKEETQTDFEVLDVLNNTPAPSSSIDACIWDGFHLDSGVKVVGGAGVLLLGGEAFAWRPWVSNMQTGQARLRLLNQRGQWEVDDAAWGLLELIWPKPDLLILGLGGSMHPLSPKTRQYVSSLGIRLDIQDTRNAAAQYNLLAKERGIESIAAAMIPFGFVEGRGCSE